VPRLEPHVRAPVGADLAVDEEEGPGGRLGVRRQVGVDALLFERSSNRAAGEVVADAPDDGRVGAGRRRPGRGDHRGAAGRHVDRRTMSFPGSTDVEHHVADCDEGPGGHLAGSLVAARATSSVSGPPGSSSARNASSTARGSHAWRFAAIVSGSWNAPPQCAHAQLSSDMS
jgi:hypothetical protein